MLTIVGWLWKSETCKAQYRPLHVQAWANAIHSNLTIDHRLVCITDQPSADFGPLVEAIPLWEDWRDLRNPRWSDQRPHCYARLKAFDPEIETILGPRFVSVDLDAVILGNLDDLFSRTEDFVILHRGDVRPKDVLTRYQGSMWMMSAGARASIWKDFKGLESIEQASKFIGTDQAWMRFKLGENEAGWTEAHGVYLWGNVKPNRKFDEAPPENAKIVFFAGQEKPWDWPDARAPRCGNCNKPINVAANSGWELRRSTRHVGPPVRNLWVGVNFWRYV